MATKKTKVAKKKTKRKVAGRTPQKRRLPGWIILMIGMLVGLIIAVFGYVSGWVPKPQYKEDKPIAQTSQTERSKAIEDKSEELKIEPKKGYDFYETLQGMEVIIDEKELKQTENRTPNNYILQLGAFKKLNDAEALKAKVAFIGLTAKIQSVDVKQTTWYRVRLGPYKGGRKAEEVKKNLDKNGFDAIILKEK